MPRLVALGDLLLDVVVTPQRPIERGTDVPGELMFRRGGSAANTAAAFVRAGGSASLITSLGDDVWGRRLATALRRDGVRVHVVRHKGPSGRLAAIVDASGERSFVTERGAADQLKPGDLRSAWLRAASILHVPAYSLFSEPIGSAAMAAVSMARGRDAYVSVDVSSQGPLLAYGVSDAWARFAEVTPDVLFANRDEATALLGKRGRRSWPGLLEIAPLVVVKEGDAGCRVLWRDRDSGAAQHVDIAAQRVAAADSTGAGDAFAAGFLFSLFKDGGRARPGGASQLRAAASAGQRAAADLLRAERPQLRLG